MALNANKLPSTKDFKYTPMDAGTRPGRLVAVMDMGLQVQRPFKGEDKAPCREIALTYELVDEFMKDEDGQDLPDKPRWVTEVLPFHPLKSEKATTTKRYNAFDPSGKLKGDFGAAINTPVNVTIVLNPGKDNRIWENVAGITTMRPKDAEKCPPLVNAPIVFDLDNPDLETFKRIPKFLQEKIRANLEYAGSPLDKLLGNAEPEVPKEKVAKAKAEVQDEKDEQPY